jgi:hypothetical protein
MRYSKKSPRMKKLLETRVQKRTLKMIVPKALSKKIGAKQHTIEKARAQRCF